jgi:hypothetical protein
MASFLTHLMLVICCGFALFRLWQATQTDERIFNGVITAGLLGRAIAGQLLFWISYARLPIARNLQAGDGVWFFATDALDYFSTATRLARAGIGAIIAFPTSTASVAFVKLLAISVLLLGDVTSVGILINLFCFLGMMAVIVHWSRKQPGARFAVGLAICAISLSPALFLWSLQPLKDTFFQFVMIAFIAACAAWQRVWATVPVRPLSVFLIGTAMLLTLTAIAGIRWYFAFALLAASAVFFLLISMRSPRKGMAFAACGVLLVLLSRAFLFAGGAYIPDVIVHGLSPVTALTKGYQLPSSLLTRIEITREGFDRAGGSTLIHAGGVTSNLDRDGNELGSQPQDAAAEGTHLPAPGKPPEALPATLPAGGLGVTSGTPAAPRPGKVSPAVAVAGPAPAVVLRLPPKKVAVAGPAPAVVLRLPPPKKAAPNSSAPVRRAPSVRKSRMASIMRRLLTGTACVIVPRSVGERLGLFHIGGGQGLFWFTDVDTLMFDAILLWAVIAVAMRLSASWRNPLVWLLGLLLLLVTLPLAYTITNYGTLFRLRAMIYVGLALTPLVLAAWPRREEVAVPESSPA